VATSPSVVLIGPPASGKTKIGRAIARSLGVPFVDTDRIITERHGPITDIFASQGEDWFRQREAEVVAECLEQSGVLSLGGGAIVTESTRDALRGQPVVLLLISEEAVSHRVENSAKRPLLTGGLESWKALVSSRMAWYQGCAEKEIDVSHRPIDDIAAEVVSWVEKRGAR
jgi:shikimate kinase